MFRSAIARTARRVAVQSARSQSRVLSIAPTRCSSTQPPSPFLGLSLDRHRRRQFHTTHPAHTATPIYLSDPGEGISEVELIKWHVAEGAPINEFDPLCEVQSDKASVEITSRHEGVVSKLKWKVGQIVKVGDVLCEVQVASGQRGGEEETREVESQQQATTTTDTQSAPEDTPSNHSTQNATPDHIRTLAVPSVRRLCREHDLRVEDINGTGKDGRVMKEDVLRYIAGQGDAAQESIEPESSTSDSNAATPTATPLTGTRKAMFKSLSLSTSIPHFTFSEEVDVTVLESVRQSLNSELASDTSTDIPQKVTLLAYLLKALSMALNTNPIFTHRLVLSSTSSTASISEQANNARLQRQTSHDISIALSTSSGLLTPTLRSLERKSVLQIASEVQSLQTQAQSGNLTAAQLGNGGLLTLSNIGSIGGGTSASPILPPTGQLAIGAVCKAKWLPRYIESDVLVGSPDATPTPRLTLPVTFAGDHRVLQGTELAKLVCDWKRLCESPYTWSARMV